jgi:hypothetical protein
VAEPLSVACCELSCLGVRGSVVSRRNRRLLLEASVMLGGVGVGLQAYNVNTQRVSARQWAVALSPCGEAQLEWSGKKGTTYRDADSAVAPAALRVLLRNSSETQLPPDGFL